MQFNRRGGEALRYYLPPLTPPKIRGDECVMQPQTPKGALMQNTF